MNNTEAKVTCFKPKITFTKTQPPHLQMEKGIGYNTRHYCWAVAVSLCRKTWTCESNCRMSCLHADVPSNNGWYSRSLAKVQRCATNLSLFYHADIQSIQKQKGKVPCKQITSFIIQEKKIKRNVIGEVKKYLMVFWDQLSLTCKALLMLNEVLSNSSVFMSLSYSYFAHVVFS